MVSVLNGSLNILEARPQGENLTFWSCCGSSFESALKSAFLNPTFDFKWSLDF